MLPRVLSRTTRSVAPTEAGEQLLKRLGPALGDVAAIFDEISGLSERPAGRVRLVAPCLAAKVVVAPRPQRFTDAFPDVVLEITTDDSPLDLSPVATTPAFTSGSSSSAT
jgi:DNA-binding transcriptional LysR family regulator